MAERRATLMEPRTESLLARVDSKFTLVTLAAMRAREINDYYNQLGEGLGKIVPPQVTSVSRKPLSISLEEIEAGKIRAIPKPPEEDAEAEAEADVAKRCAKFGRGSCEVVSFSGEQCVALATFIGRSGRRRWKLSFTAGGLTGPDAQRAAMDRCNSDARTRGQCQLRTMVCGDGR